ncbi:HK97 gp10 family phage protein [Clostridium botulinum]|uniref:HK97 gp10 family phage protein n=1 Tax=Clostridium botulinum TaxID=1491 RepID=UPI0007733364|nr:HK97 gp10 family phage protein [Clostridium botulinum]MBY6948950.1 HK97 gp10 family phage protein [Clostridium botulinum]MBY7022054.1 HK97 gp10 family phage protein [Clostridium botulinum]NFH81674.1 HK97 gp10 family phage protein [Clostridium botulinum]NFH84890.1 HK97 gp10 family phage protein [Clostridium botulinum]NFI12913.1 HK97 gp10 family phage protein [Clostridium botulinum]
MSSTFGFNEFISKINLSKQKLDNVIDDTLMEGSIEGVAEIQARTSVKTGNLRRSATSGKIEIESNIHSIKVGYDSNQAPYADAYENGHKQEVGKYVPSIGKKLVKEFVPGKHTVRDSLIIVQSELPEKLRRKIGDTFK